VPDSQVHFWLQVYRLAMLIKLADEAFVVGLAVPLIGLLVYVALGAITLVNQQTMAPLEASLLAASMVCWSETVCLPRFALRLFKFRFCYYLRVGW
jgi:hypothetical protein